MTALAGQFWLLGSALKQRQMTTTTKRGEKKNVNKGSKEHTKRGKIERPSMDSGAFPPANSTIVGAISMLRIGLCKKRTFVMPRENTSPQKGPQSSSVLQHLTPEGFNRVTVQLKVRPRQRNTWLGCDRSHLLGLAKKTRKTVTKARDTNVTEPVSSIQKKELYEGWHLLN